MPAPFPSKCLWRPSREATAFPPTTPRAGTRVAHCRAAEISMSVRITGLSTLPEVRPGDSVADLILAAVAREGQRLTRTTIVVIAQKIVSKAEGAIVDLRMIEPSSF